MPPEKLSDEAYAKRMLAKADQYLEQVDQAFILKQRGHSARSMPTFRPEEISLGDVLGTGGFGIVNEISKFTLDKEEVVDETPKGEAPQQEDPLAATATATQSDDDDDDEAAPILEVFAAKEAAHAETNGQEENDESENNNNRGVEIADGDPSDPRHLELPQEGSSEGGQHDYHYEISKARQVMQQRVLRSGKPRYALKRLHGDLSTLERARGMIDLAVEAKYLSIVWHPNIVKMRGMAKGPMVDKDFFIILDRLVETLDTRMNQSYKLHKKYSRTICGCGKNKKGLDELILQSLTTAYDLAAAFFYLHENRLVYRDIKPENIGFDMRGDVKVFDFGLCKNLSPQLKAPKGEYGYRLTGRAGSLPYMAPEVAKMQTYDTKCDVFSFCILLWEMLACRPAFDDYTSIQFMDKVVAQEERLPISKSWPPLTRLMIPEAWDTDPQKRPDMKRIAILIRGDLNDLTTDERILHRTRHLANRSQHSFNEEVSPLASKKHR